MSDTLDKLSKLINQADRAATEGEREAFMAKAQELASAAAIDLAVARAHQAKKEKREEPDKRTFQVGDYASGWSRRATQASKWLNELLLALASVNDVRCTVSSDRVYVFGYGFPSDLDVVDALFRTLSVQMVADADAALKRGEHRTMQRVPKQERVVLPEREWWWFQGRLVKHAMVDVYEDGHPVYVERMVPTVDGRVWRANFYDGWIARMRGRLWEAKRDAEKARGVDMKDEANTTAIVLRDKRQEVESFFEKEHENVVLSSAAPTEPTHYDTSAIEAGGRAAARARLDDSRDLGTTERPALEG